MIRGRTVRRSRLLRLRNGLMISAAGLPVFQFFSGCSPNIPFVPNLPGAVNFEIQNLITRVLIETFSVVIANLLNI